VTVFLLIRWEQFSCSAEMQQVWSFDLFVCWCCSGRYPRCCRGMDVVVVEWPGSCWVKAWFPCSYWLCTVTSVPSAGAGAAVGGPRGSLYCLRVPRVPRARRKYAEGIGRFDDVTGARARWKNAAQGTYLARDLSARLRWDGVYRLCRKRMTCYQRLWRIGFTGPLRWGFSDRAGCRILPSVGYPDILIPDTNVELTTIYCFFLYLNS
jgi:hypothetical protein